MFTPSSSNLSVSEPIVEVISFVPVLVSSVAKANSGQASKVLVSAARALARN